MYKLLCSIVLDSERIIINDVRKTMIFPHRKYTAYDWMARSSFLLGRKDAIN